MDKKIGFESNKMSLSVCLKTTYLAEIEKLFAENTINKGKSQLNSIVKPMNNTKKYSGTHEQQQK